MLEEQGIVVEINEQFAIVETKRTSLCGQCAANKGCGTASLASILGQKTTTIQVVKHKNTKVGDKVLIGLEEQALLKSAFAFYLPPLLGLFVAALGYDILAKTTSLPNHEILTVLAGLLGFFTGFMWVKRLAIRLSENTHYQPVILKTE
jgi:sigma-E factor negative regulatory protein RseC